MAKHKGGKDIDKAIANIMRYAEREAWRHQLNDIIENAMFAAAEDLEMDPEDIGTMLDEHGLGHMFFGFTFEWFATQRDPATGASFLDDYLQRKGWHESPRGRRYLQALNDSKLGLWEVVNVKPGSYVEIRLQGENEKPFRVTEKLGSRGLKRWDCLAARVLELDGKRMFTGAILPMPPPYARDVDELLQDYVRDTAEVMEQMSEAERLEAGVDISNTRQIQELALHASVMLLPQALLLAWLRNVVAALDAPLPAMLTTDGEAIAPAAVRFPVAEQHREQVRQRLQEAPELEQAETPQQWRWLSQAEDTAVPLGQTVLGWLELKEKDLALMVTSRPRAERGKQYLTGLLQGLVGAPLIVLENLEAMLDESTPAETIGGEHNDASTSAEMQAISSDFLTKHYRQVIDEPLPMFDQRTPRACAADPAMRDEVIAWLKMLENNTAGSPNAGYDFSWMWEELGVADSR